MQDEHLGHLICFYPSDRTYSKKNIGKRAFFASEMAAQLLSYYATDPQTLRNESELLYNFGKELFDAANSENKQTIERVFTGRRIDEASGENGGLHQGERHNSEGSFAKVASVTADEMKAAREYIDKVLGPQVKLQLAKDLGGNSSSWQRVNGEATLG